MQLQLDKYSAIISPEKYNKIRSEHVFLNEADRVIIDLLAIHVKQTISFGSKLEVLELGGGPFSLTRKLLSKDYNLSVVEVDPVFFNFAHTLNEMRNPRAAIYLQDVMEYEHHAPVDIVVSQGFHHQVIPGYLKHVYDLIADNGFYILSDEFLPEYADERERRIKAVGWYSFVIADAIRNGFMDLALEEASTLIDELNSRKLIVVKDDHTLECILLAAATIGTAENVGYRDELSKILLERMTNYSCGRIHQNLLSRGDHKISRQEFENQAKKYGFSIIDHQSLGLVDGVGGFRIFVLQKQ